MKRKPLSYCLILFLSIVFTGCGYEEPPAEVKLARSIVGKVSKNLEQRYHLHFMGLAEAGGVGYYNLIGLRFYINHALSKEEGRKILIESTEFLLNEINSSSELRPNLNPHPFTPYNVEIVIFVKNPDGSNVYFPNITVFSAVRNKVAYKTEVEEQKYEYYTVERESYEDALNIVRKNSEIENQ